MARQNHGPLSRAKGKLGGVVYQQYEGMQISREYQPVVKNPQTTKQVENRLRFKTASQILASFSDVINVRLANYSIYTRKRRSAAVSRIFHVGTFSGQTLTEEISDVCATLNSISMPTAEAPVLTKTQDGFSIVAPDEAIVVYDVVSYDSNGNFKNRVTESYTSDGTAKAVTPTLGSAETATIMVVASTPLTEAGRAFYFNVAQTANGWQNAWERAINAGDMSISDIVGDYFYRS